MSILAIIGTICLGIVFVASAGCYATIVVLIMRELLSWFVKDDE